MIEILKIGRRTEVTADIRGETEKGNRIRELDAGKTVPKRIDIMKGVRVKPHAKESDQNKTGLKKSRYKVTHKESDQNKN